MDPSRGLRPVRQKYPIDLFKLLQKQSYRVPVR